MRYRRAAGAVRGGGRVASAMAMAAAVAACSGDSTGPGPGPTGPAIATVVVRPVEDTILVGGSVQMTAVALAANGDTVRTATVVWSTPDTAVAEVSATGLVLAKAAGAAQVAARSGTRSGHTTVRVRAAPTVVAVSPASAAAGGPDLLLTITGTGFRPDTRLQWNGTARPTAYVSETVVRATIWAADRATVGEAAIQLVNPVSGGATAPMAYSIVVQPVPVASVELGRGIAYTVPGAAVPLRATLRDQAGSQLLDRLVTWTSSNQLVATVTGAGVVTPVGVGEAVITATSEGRSATLALTVAARATHLVLDDGAVGLSVLDLRLGGEPATFWQHVAGTRTTDPSLSPDGRWIAYTIEMPGASTIGVLDQATRTYRFLVSDNTSDQPAWSPTGGRIAFRSRAAGRSDVWAVNPDGTGAVNLTASMPAGWEAGWPAWSPDGARLVFSGGPAGSLTLHSMRADGTGIAPLLISSYVDTEPAWMFDAVVFTRRFADRSSDLFRIPVGGGPLVRLTYTGRASMPAWSPDGRWIAFADGAPAGGRHDILAVRPFGEEVRQLTLVTAGGGGRHPAWLSHQ